MTAADEFGRLADRLLEDAAVEPGSGFGGVPGLRVRRKIFAMLCRGELVVKLSKERVDELVSAGAAARFDARNDGRLMKEWVSVPLTHRRRWPALSREALEHVGRTA